MFLFLQGLAASKAQRYKWGASLLRYTLEVYCQYFSDKLYRLGVPEQCPEKCKGERKRRWPWPRSSLKRIAAHMAMVLWTFAAEEDKNDDHEKDFQRLKNRHFLQSSQSRASNSVVPKRSRSKHGRTQNTQKSAKSAQTQVSKKTQKSAKGRKRAQKSVAA